MRLGRELLVINFLSSSLLRCRHSHRFGGQLFQSLHSARGSSVSAASGEPLESLVDRAVELSQRFGWDDYAGLLDVDPALAPRDAWRAWIQRSAPVVYDDGAFRVQSTGAEIQVSFDALMKRAKRPFDEAVVKACLGSKRLRRDAAEGVVVWDLTAGLGRDSYLLAAAGCRCRLQEREPAVALMLADAVAREQDDRPDGPASRLWPVLADATRLSASSLPPDGQADWPDVLFIDPMFPVPGGSDEASPDKTIETEKKKKKKHTAMAKKDMQGLRDLTSAADLREQERLFRHVYRFAASAVSNSTGEERAADQRVAGGIKIVVKRHKNSPLIIPKEVLAPSSQLRLSTNRFDGYFLSPGGLKVL